MLNQSWYDFGNMDDLPAELIKAERKVSWKTIVKGFKEPFTTARARVVRYRATGVLPTYTNTATTLRNLVLQGVIKKIDPGVFAPIDYGVPSRS